MNDSILAAPANSPFTNNVLKLVAIITMIIDHVGYVLFPQLQFMRYIGRISFPIFIFLLVEGFYHTHDRRLYFLRLAAFAAISEVAFDLAFYNKMVYAKKSNVFFTLAIGFVVMLLAEFLFSVDTRTFRFPAMAYGALLGIIACTLLADLLHTDYGSYGVVAIGICYLGKHFNLHRILYMAAAIAILVPVNNIEMWAFMSLPFIWLYNGELGRKNLAFQYGCYLLYPVHLLGLYFISSARSF